MNNKDQGISPSASQHRSPQLQPSDLGLKPLPPSRQRKNASKVNTPNKILQIALDRKSHNNSEVPLQNQDSVATTASIQPALSKLSPQYIVKSKKNMNIFQCLLFLFERS